MTLIDPDIVLIAHQVRRLLEDPACHQLYIGTSNFPFGSCRDASLILGACISEGGLGDAKLMLGENADGKTHAWLEHQNFILDITADQFNDNYPSIFVQPAADFTKVHIGFTVTTALAANEAALYGYGDIELINTYQRIKAQLS